MAGAGRTAWHFPHKVMMPTLMVRHWGHAMGRYCNFVGVLVIGFFRSSYVALMETPRATSKTCCPLLSVIVLKFQPRTFPGQ